MKEFEERKILFTLDPAEEDAFDVVLEALQRMDVIFEEEKVETIYHRIPLCGDIEITSDLPAKAIMILESIVGTYM